MNVTGSSTIGMPVLGFVKTADTGVGVEKLPVTGWTASVEGTVCVTVAGAPTSIWSFDGEAEEAPDFVSIGWRTSPEAMSTFARCRLRLSPRSRRSSRRGRGLMANSEPWQPGKVAHVYV